MGNGHTLTQPGRAQLFPGEEAVDHNLSRQASVGLEQGADRLEQVRLGPGVEVEQDVPDRQQIRDLAHFR